MNVVRGTIDHPFRDLRELRSGIIGRKDCMLYTFGTFNIPDDVLEEIKERNIKLSGVALLGNSIIMDDLSKGMSDVAGINLDILSKQFEKINVAVAPKDIIVLRTEGISE